MPPDSNDNMQPCDLVSLDDALRICEMETVLLGAIGPRTALESHVLDDVIICSGEMNCPFRSRFMLPTGWYLIGYIHYTSEGSWCHGTELCSGMAFTVMPEGTSEFKLSAGSRATVALVPLQRLREKLVELWPHQSEMPLQTPLLLTTAKDKPAHGLGDTFERLRERLAHAATTDGALNEDDVEALLEQLLQASQSARTEDHPALSRKCRAQYLIVRRVEQFMRINMRRDIYLNEMCDAAGTSERALRHAFDNFLGVSPTRYLSMLRLCAAYRSLSLSNTSRYSVKSVALNCGMWDLSRFTDRYRRMFGELPRDTLKRAATGRLLTGSWFSIPPSNE